MNDEFHILFQSGMAMITGFNTDVKHKTKVYHVQTEDKGRSNPKIESLVYVGGEILDSYQTTYDEDKSTLNEDQIMELLESQHKRVIRSIKVGKYDSPEPFPEDVSSDRELDELVLEYLASEPLPDQLKLVVNGSATLRKQSQCPLKVETRTLHSGEPVKESLVRIKLLIPNRIPQLLAQGLTDETGFFVTQLGMPDYPEADCALVVQAISEIGVAEQKFPLRH